MSKEIFNTSIIKKQIFILESKLKKLDQAKELELENKKLKNQVKQLKKTGIALKQKIKELTTNTNNKNEDKDIQECYFEILFLCTSMLTTLSLAKYSKNISEEDKIDFIKLYKIKLINQRSHVETLNQIRFLSSNIFRLDIDFSFVISRDSNNIVDYYNDLCCITCYLLQICATKNPKLLKELSNYEDSLNNNIVLNKIAHTNNISYFTNIFLDLLIQKNITSINHQYNQTKVSV
ncbi:hypothetical protein [Francisella sp. SYW-9]|uniref:hypothetical protein n=1 Tax=Francisella sp. SYW-9 TaxID=2610888 RepID=UPI00123D8AF9|nr:hypothetical protein [Francisella sp. SYW-9]